MKINILILLLASFVAFSCKKKDSTAKTNNPPPSTTTNSFTLKKEGIPYTANYVLVSQVDEDELSFETRIVYNDVVNNTYGGFIKRSIQPGTYVLEDGESEYFALFHSQDASTYFGWSDGTLTVLSNDTIAKVMHCNFEITLYNDEIDQYPEITEGDFTFHY